MKGNAPIPTVIIYTKDDRLLRRAQLALEAAGITARLLRREDGSLPPPAGSLSLADLDTVGEVAGAVPMSRDATRVPGGIALPCPIDTLPRLLAEIGHPPEGSRCLPVPERRAVLLGDEEIRLSEIEYALFSLLYDADGAYVSRAEISRAVWGGHADDRLIGVYIHYLRDKLEQDGERRILCARGKGYCLRTDTERRA